ncbi:Abi family protein [Endozoicomonas sp.]|uniref:Abi family protein n=1 Tax=Endozoicomonas sp. TaxID=1892382 RepID=UPI002885F16F|nr:Abi family protein [Endozoicomonas sp.]
MDALERIEIALRVDISHFLGEKDSFAYVNPALFFDKFTSVINPKTKLTQHQDWLRRHAKLINRSKEEFIKHNKAQYGLPLPIWITCEVWDFGTLSTLYSGMRLEDQDAISVKYGVKNGRHFASWLRGLNYLRNLCAHHSRLWNRNIIDKPKLTSRGEITFVEHFRSNEHAQFRAFFLLCIAQHLMVTINPGSSWFQRLSKHMSEFPKLDHLGLNLYGMGVIDGWETWEW